MAETQKPLTTPTFKTTLDEEIKDLEEILDDALVNAMKGEHKALSLQIEKLLTDFMKSNKTMDVIANMDKYQRKIVHKICDLFGVQRDYVDVKSNDLGDITITKTEASKIPTMGLEKRYAKYLEEQKKKEKKQSVNPLANKKVLIKPKVVTKTASDGNSSDGSSGDSQKSNQEIDLIEQKKQIEYEQARVRILEGSQQETTTKSEETNQQIEKPKREKKSLKYSHPNDPDYDRSPFAFMSPVILASNSVPFYPSNYGYGYPQNQLPYNPNLQNNYQYYNSPYVQADQVYTNEFPQLNSNNYTQKRNK